MANPQPDHDFMRLSRPLLEAVTRADLNRSEVKVFLAILRASYGFSEKGTGQRLGFAALESMTGLYRSGVFRGLSGLESKGLIERVSRGHAGQRASEYAIRKDFDQWGCLPDGWAPRWTGPAGGTSSIGRTGPAGGTSTGPAGGTSTGPAGGTQEKRERREREEKGSDAEAVLRRWFELADRHREPTGKARLELLQALKAHIGDHGVDDVIATVEYLAQDDWWRGRKDGGPDRDLFSKSPISWMRKSKASEFADRVESALEWRDRGRGRGYIVLNPGLEDEYGHLPEVRQGAE